MNPTPSPTLPAAARKRLFIDGAWVNALSGQTIDCRNPATGELIATIAAGDKEDIDRAVLAARRAFSGAWSRVKPYERQMILLRLADLVEKHYEELALTDTVDMGAPISRTMGNRHRALGMLRFYAGQATTLQGETIENSFPGDYFTYTLKEPVGVVGAIIPWNSPLTASIWKLGPVLATGCTIVLKPAEDASLTVLRIAELCEEAGVPKGVVNIVTGYGHTGGDRMVKHPDVDKVAFTGSTEIGKLINRNATATLKHVTLELGGKSPVVVMPDVNVAETAPGIAGAIFFNSGQVCVAGSRLYAHKSIFDKVVEGMAETAEFWAPRPSLDPAGHMGPLVSAEQHERVMGYIDAGKRDGATVLMGGDSPSSDGGYYVNPTILTDVNPQMSVVREEIFGPVVVAQRFEDLNDVVREANDTQYGLAAGVWTKDVSAAHQIAALLKAGTVWVNCHAMIDPALPFGGYKESGVGHEQGRLGLEAYLETKTVMMKL